jgi:Fe-S cluster assembly iron-binding protein IscA
MFWRSRRKEAECRALTITPAARVRFAAMLAGHDPGVAGIRVLVTPRGQGASYRFLASAEPEPGERVTQADDLRLFHDPEASALLERAVIDFVEELGAEGFVVGRTRPTC